MLPAVTAAYAVVSLIVEYVLATVDVLDSRPRHVTVELVRRGQNLPARLRECLIMCHIFLLRFI